MMNIELLITGTLFVPIIGIFLSSLLAITLSAEFKSRLILWLSVLLSLINTILTVIGWSYLKEGMSITLGFIPGLSFDWLSLSILLISNILFFISIIYSWYYTEEDRYGSFFTMIFTLQLGVTLVLGANHFFFLFIFWELMVLTGYVLVTFDRTHEGFEAGFKYLVLSSVGSLFLLIGIGMLTALLPSLEFSSVTSRAIIQLYPSPEPLLSNNLGRIAIAFILIGFGFTAGMFGLNQWLPDAHPAAPAPVSALLSGIIVKIGIYGIYKTLNVLLIGHNINNSASVVLIIIALITMTEGNIMVFAQLQRKDIIDFKRILAYSTTVHLGYLLLIIGFDTVLSNLALILHILNHALAKGLLFLISGYLLHEYGSKDLKILKDKQIGLNDKIVGMSLFIALMSLGGLPLTGGFISKLFVLLALFTQITASTGHESFLFCALVIAVINSALAFGGYLWIVKLLIFNEEDENKVEETMEKNVQKPNIRYLFVMLAVLIIILGIFPNLIIDQILNLI